MQLHFVLEGKDRIHINFIESNDPISNAWIGHKYKLFFFKIQCGPKIKFGSSCQSFIIHEAY